MIWRSILRFSAFGLMALLTFVAAFTTAAYTFTDPGGWRGTVMVTSWLVPLLALALLAWRRPGRAVMVLGVVAALTVLLMVAAEIVDIWGGLEDRVGPLRAIVLFAAAAPMAVLGLRRAFVAGWMLVILGATPLLLGVVGPGSAPLLVVGVPLLLAGLAFLLSTGRSPTPTDDASKPREPAPVS